MSHIVCRYENRYNIYSTITDSFLFYCSMTERHVRAYLKSEYGEMQITKINNKINEANRKGHSSPLYRDLKELLKCNRMGEKESCMPFDEVIQCYFK